MVDTVVKKFMALWRIAWDDRLSRMALCLLAFLAAVSGEPMDTVILSLGLFLATAATVAFAGGGKDGLAVRPEWINAVWFGAMYLGILYGLTLVF